MSNPYDCSIQRGGDARSEPDKKPLIGPYLNSPDWKERLHRRLDTKEINQKEFNALWDFNTARMKLLGMIDDLGGQLGGVT
ncbi:hypothetical protein LCGC14_1557530 [marine sediment metagenome]|uniref:Uncharacterized protein n=1 Tax=marine sediment metagenome TaxID=412755 RepID=A0A0F9J9I5_9ZZZZ